MHVKSDIFQIIRCNYSFTFLLVQKSKQTRLTDSSRAGKDRPDHAFAIVLFVLTQKVPKKSSPAEMLQPALRKQRKFMQSSPGMAGKRLPRFTGQRLCKFSNVF